MTHDMRDSRFMQEVLNNPRSMAMETLPDGQFKATIPQYDWEDFRSFMTDFRKVAILQSEPAHLIRILNIVMKYSSDEIRGLWRDGKKRIIAIMEGRHAAMRFNALTPTGRREYSGRKVLDTLINGRIFHDSPDLADDLECLDSVEPNCHIFMVVMEVICPVLNTCIQLRNLIYYLQLLPEADFPPPDDCDNAATAQPT